MRWNEIRFELIFAAMLSKKWKWMGSSLLIWIDFDNEISLSFTERQKEKKFW
jgi:hypothetical protein